ncbi:MAG: hypothetical protein FWC50_12910 [Planctomycetaceae bacterium]|nr:hypothetical protein [Planctomycetaceae bacterium]
MTQELPIPNGKKRFRFKRRHLIVIGLICIRRTGKRDNHALVKSQRVC